ncbi:MAG: response regulator [Marinilabiliales bacterium]|nr:response regulator [Marinilabiliales bacterium]
MAGRIKRANFESQNILLELIADSGLSLMMKILICEDNQLASKAMSVVLDREGYETVIASDGNSALDILRNHEFSLVIIDIHLPYHSGLEIMDFCVPIIYRRRPCAYCHGFQ